MTATDGAARVVLDTNILIAAVRAPRSSSRRIVEACCDRILVSVVSRELLDEYRFIRGRALRGAGCDRLLDQFLAAAETVEIDADQYHVPADSDDNKVLATAADGAADVLITNDQHLLCLDPYSGTANDALRIMRPGAAARRFQLE